MSINELEIIDNNDSAEAQLIIAVKTGLSLLKTVNETADLALPKENLQITMNPDNVKKYRIS